MAHQVLANAGHCAPEFGWCGRQEKRVRQPCWLQVSAACVCSALSVRAQAMCCLYLCLLHQCSSLTQVSTLQPLQRAAHMVRTAAL